MARGAGAKEKGRHSNKRHHLVSIDVKQLISTGLMKG